MKFIVTYAGHTLKFHRNLCGGVYSVVLEAGATRFDTLEAARQCARDHHIPDSLFRVERIADEALNPIPIR